MKIASISLGGEFGIQSIAAANAPNCFSVDRLGRVTKGFYVELDHPLNKGRPSLILGEQRFVSIDLFGGRGCDYTVEGGRGRVLNASIGRFTTNSGASFPLLRKPQSGEKVLVHVDLANPDGVRLNAALEPLYVGFSGSASPIMYSMPEVLVEMGRGEDLVLFYSSGAVVRLTYDAVVASKCEIGLLAPSLALNERLDSVQDRLKAAKDKKDESAFAVAEASALHQLASILRMAKVFPEFKEKIVHAIESVWANGYRFSRTVLQHFRDVLVFLGDATIYGWMAGEDDLIQTEAVPVAVLSPRQKDGRLHGFIGDAIDSKGRSGWELAFRELVLASEQGELRPGVQIRFCTQCPPAMSDLSDQVSKLPTAVSQQGRKTSPLGNKTVLSRAESDKRRAANRADRHALQPKRGSSNGGGKSQVKGGKRK